MISIYNDSDWNFYSINTPRINSMQEKWRNSNHRKIFKYQHRLISLMLFLPVWPLPLLKAALKVSNEVYKLFLGPKRSHCPLGYIVWRGQEKLPELSRYLGKIPLWTWAKLMKENNQPIRGSAHVCYQKAGLARSRRSGIIHLTMFFRPGKVVCFTFSKTVAVLEALPVPPDMKALAAAQ